MAITKVKTLGITDANVTAAKLATDSVETAKITASNVTNAKLGSDISAAKLTAGTISGDRLPAPTLTIKGDGSSADGKLILNCSQNSHGVSIQAPPHSAAQSYNLVLPSTAPGANKILQTDGSGNLSWVDSGGGKVNQVQYGLLTSHAQSSTTTGTWTDITGLNVSITPSATNSIIYIQYSVVSCTTGADYSFFNVLRDIGGAGYGSWTGSQGDADSTNKRVSAAMAFTTSNNQITTSEGSLLKDATHNTTSAITYKVQFISGGGTFRINRPDNATTGSSGMRSLSYIMATEVLA